MMRDRSRLVGRFNAIGNDMPAETGPDGLMLIVAGVLIMAGTVAVIAVLCWSGWAFEAPISQAPVARATR